MVEEKEEKYVISRSLNGDEIVYIARNAGGRIIVREPSLEKLQAVIKKYKEPPPVKVEGEKTPVEAASAESSGEPKKKFLTNKLAEKVQKRKLVLSEVEGEQAASDESSGEPKEEKPQKKKSFWDKLK